MTPEQIKLVQTTWKSVAAISEDAAALFYGRLFTIDPSAQALFSTDMKEQGRKLMQMLATAVNGLEHIEDLIPAVEDMGRRHVDYGVEESQYSTVGSALL
ncbi:MAG: hypothetical protein KDA61_16845, partial [Planctomycetales bacterium]|nr:hypothetical protein [Planctomycetales bacterium]